MVKGLPFLLSSFEFLLELQVEYSRHSEDLLRAGSNQQRLNLYPSDLLGVGEDWAIGNTACALLLAQ